MGAQPVMTLALFGPALLVTSTIQHYEHHGPSCLYRSRHYAFTCSTHRSRHCVLHSFQDKGNSSVQTLCIQKLLLHSFQDKGQGVGTNELKSELDEFESVMKQDRCCFSTRKNHILS